MGQLDGKRLDSTTTCMLFSGNVLGYLDRAAFAVAAPLLADELALDPLRLGLLLSAFSVGYVAISFLGGVATDRWGPTKVIAASSSVWSIFYVLSGAPLPFWALVLVRIFFGAGEAPYTPAVNAIVSARASARRYSGLLAIISSGQPLGGLLAGPVVGTLTIAFGWRIAFIAIGGGGLVWATTWIVTQRSAFRGEIPRLIVGSSTVQHGPSIAATLRLCLGTPSIVGIAIAYFGFAYVLYFLLSWFPTYLVKGLGETMAEMSALNTVPWTCGLAGLLVGGLAVDFMQRFPWGAVSGRRLLLVVGLSVAGGATALTSMAVSPLSATALMSVAAVGIYLTGTCYLGLVRELVDLRQVGGVGGFAICASSLGGIVSPTLTGAVVHATGGYHAAFLLVGGVATGSAATVSLLVRKAGAPSG